MCTGGGDFRGPGVQPFALLERPLLPAPRVLLVRILEHLDSCPMFASDIQIAIALQNPLEVTHRIRAGKLKALHLVLYVKQSIRV